MEINNQLLEEIGFSKGEVKVYFALLELGETTIGPISKKSRVTPAKVYPILEKLAAKGLSTYIIKSNTKYFKATNPKQIITYLNEKESKIKKEKEEINKILPFMEAKQKLSQDLQTAEVYQTFEGLRTLYNEAIETLKEDKEDFIGFTLGEEEYKYKESEYFFQEYDSKRQVLGIKTRLISNISQRKFLNDITKQDKNIKIRYLPFQLPSGVIIFGSKVATIVWKEIPTAFVIQSNQVADSYRKFFNDLWKIAKS
jgi:HTH-type transcriptional regulator, sugar sensing transcriptional regulator